MAPPRALLVVRLPDATQVFINDSNLADAFLDKLSCCRQPAHEPTSLLPVRTSVADRAATVAASLEAHEDMHNIADYPFHSLGTALKGTEPYLSTPTKRELRRLRKAEGKAKHLWPAAARDGLGAMSRPRKACDSTEEEPERESTARHDESDHDPDLSHVSDGPSARADAGPGTESAHRHMDLDKIQPKDYIHSIVNNDSVEKDTGPGDSHAFASDVPPDNVGNLRELMKLNVDDLKNQLEGMGVTKIQCLAEDLATAVADLQEYGSARRAFEQKLHVCVQKLKEFNYEEASWWTSFDACAHKQSSRQAHSFGPRA